MKNKFAAISIILIITIILPALFFSGYEISRMRTNEKEIENIYKKQLDAILFSINQYSDDIISSWASKISASQSVSAKTDCKDFNELFSIVPQIISVSIGDYKSRTLVSYCSNGTTTDQNETISQISKLLSDSAKKVDRLVHYFKAGYRKTEPLGINPGHTSLYIVFIVSPNIKNRFQTGVIEIDEERFIRQLLGQKIQITTEDKFNICIIKSATKNLIFPVDSQKSSSNNKFNKQFRFQVKKALWLFPQYEMGIQLKGKTMDVLIKERAKLNLLLIIMVDVFFIFGVFFLFRNLRNEMKLTHIKSEFISNVSHEIRTPLALISMYIETLEMDRIKSEEKKKEYYQVIFNETQRLSGLVNKILNFSKIESGKRKFVFENANINEIVENVLQSYHFYLKSKGFELKVELESSLPLIKVDREALSDSLVNLIDNAIKYSHEVKSIEIKTGLKTGYIFVEVSDKGIGIAREEHRLIFERFYRVTKGDNVYEVKGTGLGLTIVKNIIESHNGKIEVESRPGKGSTFRLFLPVKS